MIKQTKAFKTQAFFVIITSLLLFIGTYSSSWAGAYVFAGEGNGTDIVTHPIGYTGASNQQLTLNICIDAGSQNLNELAVPVQNVINTWNNLQETVGNVNSNVLASGKLDVESILLHEVGHCIGLGHPNFAASVVSGNANNSTISTDGINNTLEINAGADGIYGSADDVRGDDENLHWFNVDNNPFLVIEPVDQSTFKRTSNNLPAGDNFSVNADRTVSNALGYPNTEAIMQQTTFTRETQRKLAADDVSTLLFARTGIDRNINTADDYSVSLNYNGVVANANTDPNCDISISIDQPSSFAFCSTGGAFLSGSNVRITSAEVHLGMPFNWFFNDVPNNPVTPPPSNITVNFNNFNVDSYGAGQDAIGTVSIEDTGTSLRLQGNRWQQIKINYTLTTDTIIEFDFSSTTEGDFHAIGFDNDLNISSNQFFKLFGTQSCCLSNYNDYIAGSGFRHYVIPVGQFYTGAMQYLLFINDHDIVNPNADSLFSNIQIYENTGAPVVIAPMIISTPSTIAMVGLSYAYDANNTVEANGTAPAIFALVNGPAGFSVSNTGEVSWTPTTGQEGSHLIEISASNSAGSVSQNYIITVGSATSPPNTPINFNNFNLGSYGGSQDDIGTVSIEDAGASLRLQGNRWQQIEINYTLTTDTLIEFDFSSISEGEVHALGFDNDLKISSNQFFKLFGTQNCCLSNFNNYIAGGVRHYIIPVGQFYTGTMGYLFFINDHDISSPNADSLFSNIRIYENTAAPVAPTIISSPSIIATEGIPYAYNTNNTVEASGTAPISFTLVNGPAGFNVSNTGVVSWIPVMTQEGSHLIEISASNSAGSVTQSYTITVDLATPPPADGVLDFNDFNLGSYGGSQDGTGTVSIEDAGTSLRLQGNRWQQIAINYTLTVDTIIEFDFSSTAEGDFHALGFDDDLGLSSNQFFKIFGRQSCCLSNFDDYIASSGVRHYAIPVGQFYTGFMQYLFFITDHDIANPNAESLFSNIQIYENPQ